MLPSLKYFKQFRFLAVLESLYCNSATVNKHGCRGSHVPMCYFVAKPNFTQEFPGFPTHERDNSCARGPGGRAGKTVRGN